VRGEDTTSKPAREETDKASQKRSGKEREPKCEIGQVARTYANGQRSDMQKRVGKSHGAEENGYHSGGKSRQGNLRKKNPREGSRKVPIKLREK